MDAEPRLEPERRSVPPAQPELLAGRYLVLHEIGVGGMARVQLGRVMARGGFVKPVAVKRLHPHLVGDPGFVALFLDEARLAARVRHPNVVSILDVLELPVPDAAAAEAPGGEPPAASEILLVLEYVEGETLGRLLKASEARGELLPTSVVSAVMLGVLQGLHAAHRATDTQGHALELVHRDVSPQNILLGTDGVSRVLDFGVAKGTGRIQSTRDGEIKGKLRYMAPEQVLGGEVDARTDVFGAGVVLYEALTGKPLIETSSRAEGLDQILRCEFPRVSEYDSELAHLDPLLEQALARDPAKRFQSALEFAIALEAALPPAPAHELSTWLAELAAPQLALRRKQLVEVETFDISRLESASGAEPAERSAPTAASSGGASVASDIASSEAAQRPGAESGAFPGYTARPKSRRSLRPFVSALLLLGVGALGLWLWSKTRYVPPPKQSLAPPAPESSISAVEGATRPSAAPEVPASAAAQGDSDPGQTEPAQRVGPPALWPRPAPPAGSSAQPKARPNPACLAPLTVDDSGIKRIKPECL